MWEWKTYECAYCLDTVTTEWISDFWDLKLPCKHQHCGNCLSRYYKHSIKDVPFKPVVCCSPAVRLPLRFLQRRLGLSSHEVAEYRSKLAELDSTVKLYCSDPKCGAFIPHALRTGRTARCRRCNGGTCVRWYALHLWFLDNLIQPPLTISTVENEPTQGTRVLLKPLPPRES
ncbi:hypothetical protein QBC43DRAFT_348575 [Cladorrhinum sp. PSN259]|nr:hypothetical protein QBC43DRAFT_348575 [Cladorrhinum sp. PSN259]